MLSITRSRSRLLAGVAAGVGRRFGINPWLVRIVWFGSVPFTFGLSVVAYALLAVVLPSEPEGAVAQPARALVPQLFAAFVLAHGIVHVLGFLPAWRLPAPEGFEYATTIFYGQVEVGDLGVKLLGIGWLVLAAAYVAAAALLWAGHPRAVAVTGAVSVASGAICLAALPLAQAGLVIDAAIVALLLVAPRMLVPVPAARTAVAAR